MKKIIFCYIIITICFAQTELQKWSAGEVSYLQPVPERREFTVDNSDIASTVLTFTRNTYWFLISDLDGNNCPFHPSCSSFFVESVKETGLWKGALMFADRFTRDLNMFNRHDYPLHSSGRLHDPVVNYELKYSKIKIFSKNKVVK